MERVTFDLVHAEQGTLLDVRGITIKPTTDP